MSTSAQNQLLHLVEEKEMEVKITDLHPTNLYFYQKRSYKPSRMLDQ